MTKQEALVGFQNLYNEIDKDNHLFVGTINPEWIQMAIEALNQNQWIPCESITEPIDREVLCCDKYGNELIGWLDYNDSEKCWICESDECVMYDTIAYMEKPKPYEGETE